MSDQQPPTTPESGPAASPDEPRIDPDQLADDLGLTHFDRAFELFDQVMVIVVPLMPANAVPVATALYAGLHRLAQHVDERLGELIDAQNTTNALLLACAPHKVTADLKVRYEEAREATPIADRDAIPSPDDMQEAAMDEVEAFALGLSEGGDDEDLDAPPMKLVE